MSKAIDAAVKCIEFNNAVYEMLDARDPTTLLAAHERAIALAIEMSALAKASDALHEMIAGTILRGAVKIELATTALADSLGRPN